MSSSDVCFFNKYSFKNTDWSNGGNNLKTAKVAILLLIVGMLLNVHAYVKKEQKERKRFSVQVVKKFSHNTRNFTQGMIYHNGKLYESTGIEHESTIQKIDVLSGKIENILDNPPEVFAEGLALLGKELF